MGLLLYSYDVLYTPTFLNNTFPKKTYFYCKCKRFWHLRSKFLVEVIVTPCILENELPICIELHNNILHHFCCSIFPNFYPKRIFNSQFTHFWGWFRTRMNSLFITVCLFTVSIRVGWQTRGTTCFDYYRFPNFLQNHNPSKNSWDI